MQKTNIHIDGRRWFQKTYGNTYHSVRIFKDGQLIAHVPYEYGYGEQFLQTALDWLRANGHIPDTCYRCHVERTKHAPDDRAGHLFGPAYGTLYLRETLGGTYSVIDVGRKGDL